MNYYEELIYKIEKLIKNNDYNEAKLLINNELNVPYIPRDIESKLYGYLNIVKIDTNILQALSDEQIIDYLKSDNEHQLIAINELNKKNLRDYIEICGDYLSSNGFINAKVLLIDSLINQEINCDFNYKKDDKIIKFNPSKLINITENDGFKLAHKKLEDIYMKEPSMFKLAEQLLYKDCLLHLPNQYNMQDVEMLVDKIEVFLDKAFNSAN